MKGKPWSAEDDKKFGWLKSVGASTKDIARFFGRSPEAIRGHAKSIRTGGSQKEPTRHCHDCGAPTTDYRCPKCWAKIRRKSGVEDYGYTVD